MQELQRFKNRKAKNVKIITIKTKVLLRYLHSMIGGAIYYLLNVPAITNLVEQLNYGLAPQENLFPRIVITERSTPENFKDGYSILNHDVEINIYASKAKDGNGGFLQASNIADEIETILYRYKGTVSGKRIDQAALLFVRPFSWLGFHLCL